MFSFTDPQASEFRAFLTSLKNQNWGGWPSPSTWPTFDGLPDYSVNQYDQGGRIAVVVKFDEPVKLGDITGTRFKVGGNPGYTPNVPRF